MAYHELTFDMQPRDYQEIARREEWHFWHAGRREILREALARHLEPNRPRRLLDVGCGPGGNIRFLRDFGTVTGVDEAQIALDFAKGCGYETLQLGDAEALPFPDGAFDAAACLDCLEHIRGDERALAEIFRVLKPGGTFLLAVPAGQRLWSRHDVALGHYRRYGKADLLSLLRDTGFKPLESSHFIAINVPVIFARRILDSLITARDARAGYDIDPSPQLNAALLALLRLEKSLLRHARLPFGSSLLVVAKKA